LYSKNDVIKPKRDFIPAGVELIMSLVDMMALSMNDFVEGVIDIVTAGDFMDITEGTQTIFI